MLKYLKQFYKKHKHINRVISFLNNKLLVILVFVLCFLTAFWFITYGNKGLFTEERGFGSYYDYLGKSILSGRLDVPEKAIGQESFVINGKFFGYFGIGPALLRIPLNYIFPSFFGHWSKIIDLIGYFITLFIAYKFYLDLVDKKNQNTKTDSLFILLFGLGTSLLFLTSFSSVYHEALIVGVLFSLLSYFYLLRFILKFKKNSNLYLSLFFAFLTCHTRLSLGIGNFVSILILVSLLFLNILFNIKLPLLKDSHRKKIVPMILTLFGLICIFFSLLFVNYLKFNNVLSFFPYEKHIQLINNKQRLDKYLKYNRYFVGNIDNIRHNFLCYFGIGGTHVQYTFPWFSFEGKRSNIKASDSIDIIEPTSSLIYSNPFLFLCIIIGVYVLYEKRNFHMFILVSGCLVTFFITISAISVSQRYFHDFFPLFLFLGILGFNYFNAIFKNKRRLFILLIALTVTYSAFINFGITLIYQRELSWLSNDSSRQDYQLFKQKINNLKFIINDGFLTKTITSDDLVVPQSPILGQIWEFGNSIFWYNGRRWLPIIADKNIRYRHYRLKVNFKFEKMKENIYEPLISESIENKGNFTAVKKNGGKLVFLQDKGWTGIYLISKPIEFPKNESILDILYDKYSNLLTIKINDQKIIEDNFIFEEMNLDSLLIGENKHSLAFENIFSGIIFEKYLNGHKIN